PSVSYQVSVVAVAIHQHTRSPLPVLTRGDPDFTTHREAVVKVQASLLPPLPTLEAINLPNQQTSARMGETLVFKGFNLSGASLAAQFLHLPSDNPLTLTATGVTPTQ